MLANQIKNIADGGGKWKSHFVCWSLWNKHLKNKTYHIKVWGGNNSSVRINHDQIKKLQYIFAWLINRSKTCKTKDVWIQNLTLIFKYPYLVLPSLQQENYIKHSPAFSYSVSIIPLSILDVTLIFLLVVRIFKKLSP